MTRLIPRDTLFGNPERASARVSHDGRWLSWLAPDEGVLNIWVAPVDDPDAARVVTHDRGRGVRVYFWAYDGAHLIYQQDEGGDENWHVHAVNLETGVDRDLTPIDGVAARVEAVSPDRPDEILVGLNDRNEQLHDVYRIELSGGDHQAAEGDTDSDTTDADEGAVERELWFENEGFVGFLIDDDFEVRFSMRMRPDGGTQILRRDDDEWAPFLEIPHSDSLTTHPVDFTRDGRELYVLDSRERDTAALRAYALEDDTWTTLASDERADVSDVLRHPATGVVEAAAATYDRKRWHILDDRIGADLEALRSVADGDLEVVSRTLDDELWVIAFLMDDGPVRYYLYDRTVASDEGDDGIDDAVSFLFTSRSELEGLPLQSMEPVIIEARDGLQLVSYLTRPPEDLPADRDEPAEPKRGDAAGAPMVLLVHGGPWARDEWGYNAHHQWLANRGYVVLSVNFRGSTGFGKDFINAANMEWGRRMHEDLLDAVDWAIANADVDPDRIAIMGGSYGGYATLVGLTFTPERFACGVDIVGPSNLITLLETIPPYWAPMIEIFTTRVGDHRTDEGRALLRERSPLTRVDAIERPLLIAQGANDPRVKQAESDQIVKAMQEKKIPVTYVLYPDEGHGFARPENRLSFYAVAEKFLAQHLGGRSEEVGTGFEGSTIQVPEGADQIPGLDDALSAQD